MKNTKEEYNSAVNDMQNLVESTTELIDMHFTQFAEFVEDKNVGVLRAYRTLFQQHLDQADMMGKSFVESTVTSFNKEERIKMGSIFSIVSKIVDRMGYIDYLIEKRKIDFQ